MYIYFYLHHYAVSLDQSKQTLKLIYNRTGILKNIPVDLLNLIFDFFITHSGI